MNTIQRYRLLDVLNKALKKGDNSTIRTELGKLLETIKALQGEEREQFGLDIINLIGAHAAEVLKNRDIKTFKSRVADACLIYNDLPGSENIALRFLALIFAFLQDKNADMELYREDIKRISQQFPQNTEIWKMAVNCYKTRLNYYQNKFWKKATAANIKEELDQLIAIGALPRKEEKPAENTRIVRTTIPTKQFTIKEWVFTGKTVLWAGPNSKEVLVHDKGDVKRWSLVTDKCIKSFDVLEQVANVYIDPTGQYVFGMCNKTEANLVNLYGTEYYPLPGADKYSGIRIHASSGVTVIFAAHLLISMHIRKGDPISTCKCEMPVKDVCFTADGKRLLAVGNLGDFSEMKLFDLNSGKCLHQYATKLWHLQSVCISPDGKYVLAGAFRDVELWDIESGQLIKTFSLEKLFQKRFVRHVCFNAEGTYVLALTDVGTLHIWNVQTGLTMEPLFHIASVFLSGSALYYTTKEDKDTGSSKLVQLFFSDEKKKSENIVTEDNVHKTIITPGTITPIKEQTTTAHTIEIGNNILDLYEVKEGPFEGGMGRVYCVYHKEWDIELAMKQSKLKTEAENDQFIIECETWMNLGLHPHIVSCYYGRDINGVLSIFSEWMGGGSLKDFIRNGDLYSIKPEEQTERILDIAIQMARGLDYAHEHDLIHRDVKPANILFSSNRKMIKIADFGIAKIKEQAYTPEYCSPEQASKSSEISYKTDIWSWAATVLEMFTKKRLWEKGDELGENYETYFTKALIPIPEPMKKLLQQCFEEKVTGRPESFAEIEEQLLQMYQIISGKPYGIKKAYLLPKTAGSLNNKALSYLDIEKPSEAEKCWKEALKLDLGHLESLYNYCVYQWKAGKIQDWDVTHLFESKFEHAEYYLGLFNLTIGDMDKAIRYFKQAMHTYPETGKIEKNLAIARKISEQNIGRRCINTFGEGIYDVNSLSISPDGSLALVGNGLGIDIWSLSENKHLRKISGHKSGVRSACFSPDGELIASAGEDGDVRLWSTKTGECLHTFKVHAAVINTVCFSSDGKRILSGSNDFYMLLLDIKTGRNIGSFGHNRPVTTIGFSPNGYQVLSTVANTMALWTIVYREKVYAEVTQTFKKNCHFLSVCFSPDGSTILAGCSGHRENMQLWDVETGECIRYFEGHVSDVLSVCFSPDGKYAISGSRDHHVKIWEIASGRCLYTCTEHVSEVTSVCFSPDGKEFLSGSKDAAIKRWSFFAAGHTEMLLSKVRSTEWIDSHTRSFNDLLDEIYTLIQKKNIKEALSKLEHLQKTPLFRNSEEYKGVLKELEKNACFTNEIINHTAQVKSFKRLTAFAYNPARNYMLTGEVEPYINVWNIDKNESICTFNRNNSAVESVCFNPTGNRVAIGNFSRQIELWDVSSGLCTHIFEGHEDAVTAVCFSPDGNKILSGSNDRKIKLWDVFTGACLYTFTGHIRGITSLSFNLEGSKFVSAGHDLTVMLWDANTGKHIRTFVDHTGSVNSVCFSPDGTKILSAADDMSVKLWDVITGECIQTYEDNERKLKTVCFNPDGSGFLSGSMALQQIADGHTIYSFDGHDSNVFSACFGTNCTKIISASLLKVIIYELEYKLALPS